MRQGKLDETPAIALVRDMMLAGASGLLKLENGPSRATVYLREGRVVFAAANKKSLRPVHWLEAAGFGTPEDLERVQPQGAGSMGQVKGWVAAGIGSREALVTAYRRCLRAVALEALSWSEGSWSFKPGSPVLTHEVSLDDPTRNLLLEAANNTSEHIGENIRRSLSGGATTTPTTTEAEPTSDAAGAPAEANDRVAHDGEDVARDGAAAETDPSRSGRDNAPVDDPIIRETLQRARSAAGQTLYDLLELTDAASEDGIRAAYYGLARRFHPDALRGPDADRHRDEIESYFASVTEAYNRLCNTEERRAYDEELRAGQRQDSAAASDPATLARKNFDQGRRALAAEQLHDASQFFANAVRLDDTKPEYHRELGIVQMKNPRWQKLAEESLQRAIDLQPADTRALVHLGRLYKSNGLKRRADEMFQKALEWDPDDTAALREMLSADDDSREGGGLLKGLLGRS